MSIDENAIINGILAHMVTLGYSTSADDQSPSDFARRKPPFAFATNVVTRVAEVEDAQSDDNATFVLNLRETSGKRAKLIADIQGLVALLEGDTTLGGTCDLCQVSDRTQAQGQDVDLRASYWTVDITARFVS